MVDKEYELNQFRIHQQTVRRRGTVPGAVQSKAITKTRNYTREADNVFGGFVCFVEESFRPHGRALGGRDTRTRA